MELMIEKLLGFVLVLTRLSAFFVVLPVFGWKSIPPRVKVAMILSLAIFFSVVMPFGLDAAKVSVLEAVLLIVNEAVYGLALGLIVVLIFSVVKFSGRVIERQMGLALAATLDPLTGERTQPLGMLIEMIFILFFLSANGHHLLLLVVSRSYEVFPVGSIPTIQVLTAGVVKAGSAMFLAGLRLSAPAFAAFIVLIVALGVLARIAPQMNILFISLPLRVGLGLVMAAIFVPFVNGFVPEFADWLEKLLPL